MICRSALGVVPATGLALLLTGCTGDAGDGSGGAGEHRQVSAVQRLVEVADAAGRFDTFKAEVSMESNGATEGNGTTAGRLLYRSRPELAYDLYLDRGTVDGRSVKGTHQKLVGGKYYSKATGSGPPGGPPRSWLRMTLEELGREAGKTAEQMLRPARQMDPAVTARMLTASQDAREAGEEPVAGVRTIRYTGACRIEDGIARLPAEQRRAMREGFAGTGIGTMRFDLWADDRRLPRRITLSWDSEDGKQEVTLQYRDFGAPVDIAKPKASDIIDFADVPTVEGGVPGT